MISATSSKTADSQSKSRPNTPAYWIFIVGLVVSSCLFWYWDRVAYGYGRGMAITLALFVFVPCVAGPFCRALGQNVAAAACASVVAGSYWTVIFLVMFVNARESFLELLVRLLYMAELFLPAVLIALAITASMNKRLGPNWGLGTVGIGFFCGAIGAGALIASKEDARTFSTGLDPRILTTDMTTINKCSQDFARSNPEKGYPESLGQLGPQGSGCVPEALLAAQVKGFTITYEPGAKDRNGKIGGYKVVARETAPVGKYVGSTFTDESGLIWTRSDGPHGKVVTWQTPSSANLKDVLFCVRQIANGPIRMNGVLISDEDEIMRSCFQIGNPYLKRSLTGKRKLSEPGYDFEYNFNAGKNGKIIGFTIEARPQPYGVAGVRSYLAVETADLTVSEYYKLKTLNVYATPEDRPATVNDPLARASEAGLDGLGPATLCIECAGDPTHSGSTDKK